MLTMGMMGISEFRTALRTLATLGKADKPQFFHDWASLVAQMVKNLPAVQETVQPLGQEDPLEKEMATHYSILAWRIPWTEEPAGLQPIGGKESEMTKRLTLSLHFCSMITSVI